MNRKSSEAKFRCVASQKIKKLTLMKQNQQIHSFQRQSPTKLFSSSQHSQEATDSLLSD